MKRAVLLLALSMLACRAPYRPAVGTSHGYLEDQLSPRIYQVHYQGNTDQSRGANSEQLVLLRAADLTIEHGYSYFIVDRNALPGVPRGRRSLTIKLFSEPPVAEDVKVYDARGIAAQIRARHHYLAE